MDTVLLILNLATVAILIMLLLKKSAPNRDLSGLTERLIRVEGELDKLTPKIESAFRENRHEIAESLHNIQRTLDTRVKTLQDDNAKKLEEMRR